MNLCITKVKPKTNKTNIELVNDRIDIVVGYSEVISTSNIEQLRVMKTALRDQISFADTTTDAVLAVRSYSERHDRSDHGKRYRKGLDNELMSLGDLRYAATTTLDKVGAQIRAFATC